MDKENLDLLVALTNLLSVLYANENSKRYNGELMREVQEKIQEVIK